jgi:hypothetical protein
MDAPTTPPAPTPETQAPSAGRRRWVVPLLALVAVGVAAVAWLVLGHRSDDGAPGGRVADGNEVSVLDVGAVGDGTTDDSKALQAAFDAAAPGDTVELPKGHTFAHAAVLTLKNPDVTVSGGGTLLATDEQTSSLVLAADRVVLDDVTLAVGPTTKRWDAYEQQRLRLDGHTGIVVRDVAVTGSAAAGVYVGGGTADFLLDHVTVSGTRADGIHITQGSHDGKVVSPAVTDVGDDGVAVVSYAQDGDPCARITVSDPKVDGSSGGRGVSVVGGTDVTYTDIDVRRTYAAAVYVAAEGSFDSTGVQGVKIDGGTVADANVGQDIDHGAVLVYNGTNDKTISGVDISGLTISDTRSSASRWVGLVQDHDGGIDGVQLTDLALDGDGPGELFVSSRPSIGYKTSGWTRDGKDVGDEQSTAAAGTTAPTTAAPTSAAPSSGSTPTAGTTTSATTSSARTSPSAAPSTSATASARTAGGGAGTSASTVSVVTGATVSVRTFGAVGDGRTDDTAALQRAFDAARPGDTVLLPAGNTFAHSAVLTITRPGITVTGGGTLLATDESRSSLTLAADRVLLSDVTLRVAKTTKRWSAYEQQRLRIDGHTGITVRRVTVQGSAAGGVYVGGRAADFLLDHVTVTGTRADGIHLTQGSHDGRVVSPVVRGVGDDGVAVVSYAQDGDPCARITISDPVVDGSSGGRGISVVGGRDITYTGIDVRNTYAAGVYVAAEGGWNSTGVDRVRITGGAVRAANTGPGIDHGAVLVYDGTADRAVRDVTVSGLTLSGLRSDASRWVGLVADSTGRIGAVRLAGITISGPGPVTAFVSNARSTVYSLADWRRNGVVMAAQSQG